MLAKLLNRKAGPKITMLTAYDFQTARLLAETGIDLILVGDSLGVVFQGKTSTREVTMQEMLYHCDAVVRGAGQVPVIVDLPIHSYNTPEDAVYNSMQFIEKGASGVKLEGYQPGIVKALTLAKIPVMGHLGVLPQTAKYYRVTGKDRAEAERLRLEAKGLVAEGVFALVLECMTEGLAREITSMVAVPTIGIGAGKFCDGQVLVITDLLGLSPGKLPKFVKRYVDLSSIIKEAVLSFKQEVERGLYPDNEHTYH